TLWTAFLRIVDMEAGCGSPPTIGICGTSATVGAARRIEDRNPCGTESVLQERLDLGIIRIHDGIVIVEVGDRRGRDNEFEALALDRWGDWDSADVGNFDVVVFDFEENLRVTACISGTLKHRLFRLRYDEAQ